MPQNIIGSVVVSAQSVRVGESLLVDVLSPAGTSYNNEETDLVITINGVRGSKKYLQFRHAGPRRISVVAGRPGQPVERKSVSVTVLPAEGAAVAAAIPSARRVTGLNLFAADTLPKGAPLLSAQPDVSRPGVLRFRLPEITVAQRAQTMAAQRALRAPIVARARLLASQPTLPLQPHALPLQPHALPLQPHAPAQPAAPQRARLDVKEQAARRLIGIVSQMSTYEWDFGDGRKLVTASPDVEHDYSESVPVNREYGHFHMKVTQRRGGRSVCTSTRTVTVLNPYFVLRQRGVIQPKVSERDDVRPVGDRWVAALEVHNREPQPLRLTSRQIQFVTDAADDARTPLPAEPVQIEVPANGRARVEVSVLRRALPRDATGFAAHFSGTSSDGTPAQCSGFFDIPLRSKRWTLVGNPAEIAALNALSRSGATSSASVITAEELANLTDDGRADAAAFPSMVHLMAHRMRADASFVPYLSSLRVFTAQPGVSVAALIAAASAGAPREGDECDPDHLPDNVPAGFACQMTSEKRWVTVPGRFVNARKGDVILSQGGPGGLIGGLLRQVHPPQRYSHSGIMTRNFDQVTHSTASPAWLLDHPVGSIAIIDEPAPTEGLVPNALKYLWPGVITQSVEASVEGEELRDPEGRPRTLSGFSALPDEGDFNGVWELVPPLVVKPDPKLETAEVRATLKRVADYAAAQRGRSHYRFYCYTDPTIGLTTTAPPDAGWAAGTYPSVCSSFIWMCHKKNNVRLEGPGAVTTPADLEPKDVSAKVGAEVNAQTRDGLYLYRADERRVAAEWLSDTLQQEVWSNLEEKAGVGAGVIDLFSDICEDVANQMVNTFASDWSDKAAKDSDRWRTTGDANAVSPDNILNWDSPAKGSVYGFAEELRYEPPQYREVTIWRWKKVQKFGTLTGKVTFNNVAVNGASVELYDGKTAATDAAGRFTLRDVPVGDYELKASVWKDGFHLSSATRVSVREGQNQHDLALQMPPELTRRVSVEATLYSVDDEDWPWTDEKHTAKLAKQVILGPWHTHEEVSFVDKMGGEIRSELHVVLDLDATLAVNVKFVAKLFEGTTVETDDLDAQSGNHFTVQKNLKGSWHGKLVNGEFKSDDSLSFDFTVRNERY